MLNVMIVDDEPSNIQGLVRYIKWQDHGYAPPVTHESGEEALEALQETEFDVLISDVSMPDMNGIELVARAKALYPHIQVLMISGYNEFEFVQDAIHVGAQAYVLKPLKFEEVTSRLDTFRATLEKMQQIVEQTSELEKKVSGSLKVVKERFVNDLIAEMVQTDDMLLSWKSLMELPQIAHGLRVILFGLDHFLSLSKDAKERMVLGSGFRKTVDVGLSDLESLYVAQTAPDEIAVLHVNPTPEESAALEKQMVFIQRMMEEQYGSTVTVGLSRTGDGWVDAPLCYKEVKFKMAQARLMSDGQIVHYDPTDSHEFKEYRLREEFMPNIVKLMESGDRAKVGEYMNRVFDLLQSQEPFSFSYAQAFGMSFLSELIRILKWQNGAEGEINILMWRRMLDCSSTSQIIELLVEYVDRYMLVEKKEQGHQLHNLIRQIAAFIEERVHESWTVKQLAEQFNLNASYLSVLFKKEMGKTISEFVQETRIQLAKQLLQDPGIKVYEVADRVGIQTSAYFTYLFKKMVNCTPQEFRDHHYSVDGSGSGGGARPGAGR
ncbi:response regulator transcription factor [Paenibacillus radicis (ex Gao et al. 2016)]|uniref:Two-component sensor response regulator n=1 Tax=Paenibacillus radicis (ex Gao et al. 2016) TaxID=1737354 RepID=A0A917GXT3_9BACL|nr:response regulator [Paenibacillus radicis (ex Gao et al. 2016)]GGG60991.1 putative two-component sensor response regulator [Paenibacillus radicis (ex Gao et al. 2016)]